MEARGEAKANEIRQDIASTLEELKATMAAIREVQEKMWRAIDDISKELQRLVQCDVCTNGGEGTEPMPANVNLDKEELVLVVESSITPTVQYHDNRPYTFYLACWDSKRRRSSQC